MYREEKIFISIQIACTSISQKEQDPSKCVAVQMNSSLPPEEHFI